jgi:hypothetical protein
MITSTSDKVKIIQAKMVETGFLQRLSRAGLHPEVFALVTAGNFYDAYVEMRKIPQLSALADELEKIVEALR